MTHNLLTKPEAIAAMKAGKRLTHRFFTEAKWVTLKNGAMLYEDGTTCTPSEFWNVRFSQYWFTCWQIVQDDVATQKK